MRAIFASVIDSNFFFCVWRPVANKLHPEWPPVAYKLYPSGRQSHANNGCDWRPVACKLYLCGSHSNANCSRVAASCRQIPVDFIHVACNWRPRGYNLPANDGHSSGTICMPLAASRMRYNAKPPVFLKHAARKII
jgi:hypothetical protein